MFCCAACAACAALVGCGTTISRTATEQLLASDAVDRSVAKIDFRALAGEKVYFDTQYIKHIKGHGFVNAEYITSGLRQQLAAADCRLQETIDEADYVVEARVGTLGSDGHDLTYGIPANKSLSDAASLVPTAPPLPSIPEISLARKNNYLAAAKIGAFAYDRTTREIVWQSGISESRSTAKSTWILGAGPFQSGTIYEGTEFAGAKLGSKRKENKPQANRPGLVDFTKELRFDASMQPLPEDAGPEEKTAEVSKEDDAPKAAANGDENEAKTDSTQASAKSPSPTADPASAKTENETDSTTTGAPAASAQSQPPKESLAAPPQTATAFSNSSEIPLYEPQRRSKGLGRFFRNPFRLQINSGDEWSANDGDAAEPDGEQKQPFWRFQPTDRVKQFWMRDEEPGRAGV